MQDNSSPQKIWRIFGLQRFLRHWLEKTPGAKARWKQNKAKYGKIALLVSFSLVAAAILYPRPQVSHRNYEVGDIAASDIKARTDFLITDEESTAKRRHELLQDVPLVFDFDERIGEDIQSRLHNAFAFLRASIGDAGKQTTSPTQPFHRIYKSLLEKKPEFESLLGIPLSNNIFYLLAQAGFAPAVEELLSQQVSQIMAQGVISDHALLGSERRHNIIVRRLPSRNESLQKNPEAFVNLEEAQKKVGFYCREMAADLPAGQRWAICELAQALVVPNLILNRAESEERKQSALKELRPVYFQVKKGEMLVREGERLTPLHLVKIQAHQKEGPRGWWLLKYLTTALLLGALVGISYHTACLYIRHFPTELLELTFLTTVLLITALFNKVLANLGDALLYAAPLLAKNLVFMFPAVLAPMLVGIFFGVEGAVLTAFLSSIMAAMLVEKPLTLFIYFTISGLVGVWGIKHCKSRWVIIKTGLILGLANMALVAVLKLSEYPFSLTNLSTGMLFGLAGGLLIGILVSGITPLMEVVFKFTSDIRLLELLNLDQPIMRDLMVMAPGTYHHSIIVGNLVEAAAESIGANPLLAKSAAYYHDIGKIKKPAYFVENQLGRENKHEKLAPSMSSLILIAHVKDGVELARQNRVGTRITDIIRQHHGTSFISYFYNKAKQLATSPQQVNIEDFRYPGPRPQTKEAGLVLLADQVEAASKTLLEPTPARIQGMVQKIINNNFADGQLDECELTLKDLHQIARSFIKILSGIFHQRIEYPTPAEKTTTDKKKNHEDLDKQPAKKDLHKPAADQGKNREDLKRLGIT